MGKFKSYTMTGFGGLNEDEDPTALKPVDLTNATNVARRGRATGTRPGTQLDATGEYPTAIGAFAVQGLKEWRRNQDATRHFVTIANGVVRIGVATVLGAGATTITAGADNVWTFADHNNKLFAAGGALGDSFWYWDGVPANPLVAVNIQNSAAQTLRPRYVYQWKNYVIVSGMDRLLPDDNPTIWRYHNLGSDPGVAASWPVGNTIGGGGIGGLPGFGSEFSTGIAEVQDNTGDFLLCLTNRKLYAYQLDPNALIGFVQRDSIANGCVNQRAFVSLGVDFGDAIYVSEQGVHSLRLSTQFGGHQRAFLSWPIRKTFQTLNRNRLRYITGGYWATEGIVAFAVSTGSSTAHDLVLAMDIQGVDEVTPDTVRWYKWYLSGYKLNALNFARDTNGQPYLYAGTTDGKIVRFNRATYNDSGAAYNVVMRTAHNNFEAPGVEKVIGDMSAIIASANNYSITHKHILDYGARTRTPTIVPLYSSGGTLGSTPGSFVLGAGNSQLGIGDHYNMTKTYGAGRAESVAQEFSHGGLNQPFFVSQIVQDVAAGGELVGDTSEN